MEHKHTLQGLSLFGLDNGRYVLETDKEVIGSIDGSSNVYENHANARFIVAACNNHQRLLDALIESNKVIAFERGTNDEQYIANRSLIEEIERV